MSQCFSEALGLPSGVNLFGLEYEQANWRPDSWVAVALRTLFDWIGLCVGEPANFTSHVIPLLVLCPMLYPRARRLGGLGLAYLVAGIVQFSASSLHHFQPYSRSDLQCMDHTAVPVLISVSLVILAASGALYGVRRAIGVVVGVAIGVGGIAWKLVSFEALSGRFVHMPDNHVSLNVWPILFVSTVFGLVIYVWLKAYPKAQDYLAIGGVAYIVAAVLAVLDQGHIQIANVFVLDDHLLFHLLIVLGYWLVFLALEHIRSRSGEIVRGE